MKRISLKDAIEGLKALDITVTPEDGMYRMTFNDFEDNIKNGGLFKGHDIVAIFKASLPKIDVAETNLQLEELRKDSEKNADRIKELEFRLSHNGRVISAERLRRGIPLWSETAVPEFSVSYTADRRELHISLKDPSEDPDPILSALEKVHIPIKDMRVNRYVAYSALVAGGLRV